MISLDAWHAPLRIQVHRESQNVAGNKNSMKSLKRWALIIVSGVCVTLCSVSLCLALSASPVSMEVPYSVQYRYRSDCVSAAPLWQWPCLMWALGLITVPVVIFSCSLLAPRSCADWRRSRTHHILQSKADGVEVRHDARSHWCAVLLL